MELTLVIRSQEEMAAMIEAIVRGTAEGLRNARTGATDADKVHAMPPEDLTITGIFLIATNVEQIEESVITSAATTVVTDANSATTVVSTRVAGAQSNTESATPANRTTTRGESGGDALEENIDYEEIT
jgi:hypothetical protein